MILVFDFDGTIHRTDLIYEPSLKEVLKDLDIDIEKLDYQKFIGMPASDAWKMILGDDPNTDNYIRTTGQLIDRNMKTYGKLYDHTYETLDYLKDKYEMIILSNCRNDYMKLAREIYSLDKYFSKYLTGEDFNYIEKSAILRSQIDGDFIVIGDRENDILAGYKNNMKSIFCKYGYGEDKEGEHSTYQIENIRDLLDIL